MKKFKLIKAYPLSPPIGTIVIFEGNRKYTVHINIKDKLFIGDCINYPDFWEDITQDIKADVDAIFSKSEFPAYDNIVNWHYELNIEHCKTKIVDYIKTLLKNENKNNTGK